MGTSHTSTGTVVTPPVPAAGGPGWTRTSLGLHLLGSTNQDRNASGGAIPDRLDRLVYEAYKQLWTMEDWLFRLRRVDLTLTIGTVTKALPADFDKFSARWVRDSAQLARFRITDDLNAFDHVAWANATRTGPPEMGFIEETTVDSAHALLLRVTPIPDAAHVLPICYLCTPPALDAAAAALWRPAFDEGWFRLAKMKVQQDFDRNPLWETTYRWFMAWHEQQAGQIERPFADTSTDIQDDYGDLDSLASATYPL